MPGLVLVDSNVLLDILEEDRVWYRWSAETLAAVAEHSALAINPVIFAEVSIGFSRIEEVEEALPPDLNEYSLVSRPGT